MPSVGKHQTKCINLKFEVFLFNWPSIMMRTRDLASVTDVFEVEVFDVWPATNGDEYNISLELIESRLWPC